MLVVVHTIGADILLLKRIRPFEFWQSVTGSLQPGESQADAAVRELAEETGIDAGSDLTFSGHTRQFEIDRRWRKRFRPGTTHNTEHEWRIQLPATVDIAIDPSEHSAFRWLPIEQAIETVWSWTNREALESLRSEL